MINKDRAGPIPHELASTTLTLMCVYELEERSGARVQGRVTRGGMQVTREVWYRRIGKLGGIVKPI